MGHYIACALCIAIHLLVILHIFLPKTAAMSSSTPTKRVRTSSSSQEKKDQGHLESWFNGDAEQIQTYIHSYNRKSLIAPKFVTSRWLKEQQLDEIIGILNHQKLRKFLGMNGCIYPDLVKVLYTNLIFDGQNMCTHVKGVDMLITPKEWFAITILRHEG